MTRRVVIWCSFPKERSGPPEFAGVRTLKIEPWLFRYYRSGGVNPAGHQSLEGGSRRGGTPPDGIQGLDAISRSSKTSIEFRSFQPLESGIDIAMKLGQIPGSAPPLQTGCPPDGTDAMKRVLLVDDDPYAREIYGEMLEYAGFAVSLAVDGEEALGCAFSEVPALILMDIHMPRLGGWEALQALKDDPRTGSIPVVAITANGGSENLRRAASSRFESYLVKPISPGAVLAEVQRLIGAPSKDSSR